MNKNQYNIKIKGNFNFFVNVESKGDFLTTSSNISISCFTRNNRKIIIASKFKWKRMDISSYDEIIPISTNYY